jgi:hypothetical protein
MQEGGLFEVRSLTCGAGPGSWAGGAISPCCACSRWWAACEAAMSAASFCCRRCCSVCTGYQYHASADMTSSFAVQLRLQTWSRHGASAATAPTIHSSAVTCWHEGLRVLLLQTGRSASRPSAHRKGRQLADGLVPAVHRRHHWRLFLRPLQQRPQQRRPPQVLWEPGSTCDCSSTRHTACSRAMKASLPRSCGLLRSLALHAEMDAAPAIPLATLKP